MNCSEVQAGLVAGFDSGEAMPELEAHCRSCERCAEVRDSLAMMFQQLDDLPKPGLMSGEGLERTLQLSKPTRPALGVLEVWSGFCELLARRPALAFGLAIVCFFSGMLVSRPARLESASAQTNQTLETLTRQIAELNEAVALVKLEQASASDRLQAVHWIGSQGPTDMALVEALGSVLETDENVNVRLAAIDALSGQADVPEVRSLLIESLKKPQSPLVRIALIERLVNGAEPAVVAVFQAIAADESSHEAVRERARAAAANSI